MKLYIIRVGETDYKECIKGLSDEDLNEFGRKQIEKLSDEIKYIKFDHIYSSPLKRAKTTLDILNNKNVVYEFSSNLEERDAMDFINLPLSSIDIEDWWSYFPKREYKAETVKDLYKRVIGFIEDLRSKHDEDDILIITHNGVIICINAYFQGIPDDYLLDKYSIENGQMLIYELKKESNDNNL